MPGNEIDDEIGKLFEYLGLPNHFNTSSPQATSQAPSGDSTVVVPGIPPGWGRLDFNKLKGSFKSEQEFSSFQTKIYEKSQLILNKYRDKPYGTKIRFTVDGKVFIALLEEHEGGAVKGKHPGVSVLEEIFNAAPASPAFPAAAAGNAAGLSKIDGLDQTMQAPAKKLIELAAKAGIILVVTSGYRNTIEQDKLYEQGKTPVGGGLSHHNYGLAFDVAPVDSSGDPHYPDDNELWNKIGQIGKSVGFKWGGDFSKPDRPHFEHPTAKIEDLISGKIKTRYSKESKVADRQLRIGLLDMFVK